MIKAVLAVLAVLCICMAVQRVSGILEMQFLLRQLEEIGDGSQMELSTRSRRKQMLALCNRLNEIYRQKNQQLLQHKKAEKQLLLNITGLAHDIRTPLTGAAGYVQMALECGETPKQERYLQTAAGRMQELGDMLEELFLYTKLTSGEFAPVLHEIQVLPVLSDCLVGMYRQFEEKGVAPSAEFASEGFRVLADEEWLRRMFHNLIQNALVHGEGGIAIRQKGNLLVFENAVPASESPDPERMFEQFYKADSARRKGSSGLGLFVVKELAQRLGWKVQAQLQGNMLRIVLEFPCGADSGNGLRMLELPSE